MEIFLILRFLVYELFFARIRKITVQTKEKIVLPLSFHPAPVIPVNMKSSVSSTALPEPVDGKAGCSRADPPFAGNALHIDIVMGDLIACEERQVGLAILRIYKRIPV